MVQFVCAYCRRNKGLSHKPSCTVVRHNTSEKWVDKDLKSPFRMTDST